VSISIYYGDVRKELTLVFAFVLLASGCGSGGGGTTTTGNVTVPIADQTAAQFAVVVQAQLKSGRFREAWQTLHPAERKVVSVQRLASCYPKNEFPGAVTFRARQVRDVRWTVPGTGETTDAKEVTIVAKSAKAPPQTFTQHVVHVGKSWAWMLSGAYFRRAKAGTC
jgi:hypothetical protein